MSVIPERPVSADNAVENHTNYIREIDYGMSLMNHDAMRQKSRNDVKRLKKQAEEAEKQIED